MVAFLRQFIVVLLVLLQFAAPLVHAHVDESGLARGLHLHEFEALHVKPDALLVTATDYSASSPYAIVELGQLIEVRQHAEDFSAVYYLHGDDVPFVDQRMVGTINFSPHVSVCPTEPCLSQNPSRAPPLL